VSNNNNKGDKSFLQERVDLVVTFGGDGTLLHVAPLFDTWIPPVVSFSMGTLGFLLPFRTCRVRLLCFGLFDEFLSCVGVASYRDVLSYVLKGNVRTLLRMRLACSVLDAQGRLLKRGRANIGKWS
jgi:NADH kinase